MKISVYDIEIFPNFFCCTFKDIATGERRSFRVAPWVSEWVEFLLYFKSHDGLIGYNNFNYDYRVLSPFLHDYPDKVEELLDALYQRSQDVLEEDFKEPWETPIIPQRDLFRVWHFNNKARMVSLKYLQFNMGWRNMAESPFPWNLPVKEEDVPLILEYNINDVESTEEFYKRSKDKIKLRSTLGDLYDVNMGNFSDNKIGETIFLKEMARRTGRSEKSIAAGRTPRKNIPVRDILHENIEFSTPQFQAILEKYRAKVITQTKLSAAEKKKQRMFALLDGTKYEFGMGGLHALRGPGLYHNIQSADVSSYYPNLAISYRLHPAHLGEVFCDVYDLIYKLKQNSTKGSDENTAYKAALVCVFGSSNAQWSPFYDPRYTMSITILGQLILAMLCEQVVTSGAGHVIMANTDGIEVDVIDYPKFKNVCFAWEQKHKFMLEFTEYKQIAIRDVNAYHAIKTDGKVKTKGDFEITKEIWKDSSMRIVPIAVDKYFREGTRVETTVNESADISLFFIGKRAKTGKLEYRTTDDKGELVRRKLPKNVRYLITRSGGAIVKVTKATEKQNKKKEVVPENQTDLFAPVKPRKKSKIEGENKITSIHSGYRMQICNQWKDKPFNEYDVDKQFYIREANKLINSTTNKSNIFMKNIKIIRFKKGLTKAQKRVIVAKDALAQIKIGKFLASPGDVISFVGMFTNENKGEMQPFF